MAEAENAGCHGVNFGAKEGGGYLLYILLDDKVADDEIRAARRRTRPIVVHRRSELA